MLPDLNLFATEAPTRRPKATKGTPGDPQNTPESQSETLLSMPRRSKGPHRTLQETPKRRPRHPRGAFGASFWPHFGSLDGSLDGSLIFHGFVMLFASLFELMLAPFSIPKLIMFVIQFCMFFYCVSTPFFFNFTSIFKDDAQLIHARIERVNFVISSVSPAREADFQEPGLSKNIKTSSKICPKIHPKKTKKNDRKTPPNTYLKILKKPPKMKQKTG